MKGRRLPDTTWGELPTEFQPGDIWKVLHKQTGEPLTVADYAGEQEAASTTNLTGGVWMFYSPDGNGLGTLVHHTVREHEDGTVSVRPGDGSSNSILHSGGAQNKSWHGYVEHNEWTPA